MYLQTFKIKILHYFLQISFYTTIWDFFFQFYNSIVIFPHLWGNKTKHFQFS